MKYRKGLMTALLYLSMSGVNMFPQSDLIYSKSKPKTLSQDEIEKIKQDIRKKRKRKRKAK